MPKQNNNKKSKSQKAPKPAVVAEVKKVVKGNKRPKQSPVNSTASVKSNKKKQSKIDWSIVRNSYITDPKATIRSLAEKFGISRSSVQKQCKKENWTGARQEYVKQSDSNVIANASEDREQLISDLNKKHTDMFDGIAQKVKSATEKLSLDEWAAKNLESLAKAAKHVMEAERLVIGLPSDVKGLSDPRGDKLTVTIESLHDKAKEVLNGKNKS